MKSELSFLLRLLGLLLTLSGPALGASSHRVSVAALSVPDGSDGKLHWRAAADQDTQEIQLSTRYFSSPVKMKGAVVQFFDQPVSAKAEDPVPLVSARLPSEAGTVYLVLWSGQGEDGKPKWRARSFAAADWSMHSLKVLNGSTEALGIVADERRIPLPRGKAADFHARTWKEPFEVKIYRQSSRKRPVFSSKWRVGQGRRELCFLYDKGKKISIRSLIDLAEPPPGS